MLRCKSHHNESTSNQSRPSAPPLPSTCSNLSSKAAPMTSPTLERTFEASDGVGDDAICASNPCDAREAESTSDSVDVAPVGAYVCIARVNCGVRLAQSKAEKRRAMSLLVQPCHHHSDDQKAHWIQHSTTPTALSKMPSAHSCFAMPAPQLHLPRD